MFLLKKISYLKRYSLGTGRRKYKNIQDKCSPMKFGVKIRQKVNWTNLILLAGCVDTLIVALPTIGYF